MSPETVTPQAPPARSRNRAEIPEKHKWNVQDIFSSWEEWDAAYKQLEYYVKNKLPIPAGYGEAAPPSASEEGKKEEGAKEAKKEPGKK